MNININSYGSGRPIVFFHGWGFDSQIWLSLLPGLIQKHTVILVDLPGFGFTPMMDAEAFQTQLLAILPKQFALVGWSLGGFYATKIAIEHQNRVSHLLNVSSSPKFMLDEGWPGVSQESLAVYYVNLANNPEQAVKDFIASQMGHRNINYSPVTSPSQMGLQKGLDVLNTWDFRDELKSLQVPVTYLFGRLDAIIPAKTMDVMKLIYPDFNYLLFRKSAHMPFLSQKDEFISELLSFIK